MRMGVKGESNVMDSILCALWIALLWIRITATTVTVDSVFSSRSIVIIKIYRVLFALMLVALTWRFLVVLNANLYFGKLLKIIKVMSWESIKFFGFVFIVFVSIFLAAMFMSHDDKDSEFYDFWNGMLFSLAVFFGGEDGQWSESGDGISTSFMVIVGLFGTMLITNLLIAILTNEYDRVSEQAAAEIMSNKTELVYDLLDSHRLMPPPLTTLVLFLAAIVWILNLMVSLIYPRWNLYAHIHYGTFQSLTKRFDLRELRCRCTSQEDSTAPSTTTDKIGPSGYFQSMTRLRVLKWHFLGLFSMLSCGHSVKNRCIHHRGCYGYLEIRGKKKETKKYRAVDGIRMAEWLHRYEQESGAQIAADDSEGLMRVTNAADVLFCRYCNRSFSCSKFEEELASPFTGLLELLSSFVFLIIVYLPLLPLMIALCKIINVYRRKASKKLSGF